MPCALRVGKYATSPKVHDRHEKAAARSCSEGNGSGETKEGIFPVGGIAPPGRERTSWIPPEER